MNGDQTHEKINPFDSWRWTMIQISLVVNAIPYDSIFHNLKLHFIQFKRKKKKKSLNRFRSHFMMRIYERIHRHINWWTQDGFKANLLFRYHSPALCKYSAETELNCLFNSSIFFLLQILLLLLLFNRFVNDSHD